MVSRDRWFYNEMKLKVVNSYKYFGINITTKNKPILVMYVKICLGGGGGGGGEGGSSCRY